MTDVNANSQYPRKPRWRKWIGRVFLAWGVIAFTYIFSGYRTVNVDGSLLQGDVTVSVLENAESLQFTPTEFDTGLIFFCGSGVSAHAYAPMLRPVADHGFAVFVVKLPYRFAPFESHRSEAVRRASQLVVEHPGVIRWVISGHSLGGALACRVARDKPATIGGLVLVGTTHPKSDDLSSVVFPVTKVHASNDGIAPVHKVNANKRLLPANTKYVLIKGGNHSQFGRSQPRNIGLNPKPWTFFARCEHELASSTRFGSLAARLRKRALAQETSDATT